MTYFKKPRYVVEDVDRHGNVRRYFRKKNRRKIRLHGDYGSAAFIQSYNNALADNEKNKKAVGLRTSIGSFGYVCLKYFSSADFKALDVSTQKQRRYFLESVCGKHANKPISLMRSTHVEDLLETKRETPAAARNLLKSLNALFRWAKGKRMVEDDPTQGVKPIPYVTEGHHTWTEEEVAKFEACHPVGSQARLALALLLFTGCRRGDVVSLGPQHIKKGRLRYTQDKNKRRSPVHIDLPVHPELEQIISASPSGHMTFLVTAAGKPFTREYFGNWFRKRCSESGLHQCSPHGLRKSIAARLVDGGATPHELMAVLGHKSLAEVERYTKGANKAKLADSAMKKFIRRT